MSVHHAAILGGSKGLGLALARSAVRHGLHPVIYGRTAPALRDDRLGPAPICHTLDLAAIDSVEAAPLPPPTTTHLFWVAGIFARGPLACSTPFLEARMLDIHLRGPVRFLARFLGARTTPFHLVTIASSSSWRLREEEALYCAVKAAKAAFTRSLAVELRRSLPGSRVTLIQPGGMATPNFWAETGMPLEGFMDPARVAESIWDEVLAQRQTFLELQILRDKSGGEPTRPMITRGPRLPETLDDDEIF